VLVITVVEDSRALARIDEIAATPEIDVIFIGTSDLSFSLGLRGRQDDRQLDAAIAKIIGAAKRHRKVLGRPARTPQEVRRYQKQGFRFFMTATELELMAEGSAQLLRPLGRNQAPVSNAGL